MNIRRVLRWGLAAIFLLLTIAYGVVSYAMASSVTTVERMALERHPSEFGLAFEEVEFSPRGGEIVLRGWYFNGKTDGPSIILVHGVDSNRATEEILGLTRALFHRGFNILAFDLRAHGESEGDFMSAGFFEKWDVLGAYDFLVGRGAAPESIGVLGWSLGGAVALLAAAEEPGMRAAVADSSFADVHDLIAQETARSTIFPEWMVPVFIPGMKVMSRILHGIKVGEIVPENAVTSLDYPILVIHVADDMRIPVGQGVRIHEAAAAGSDFWLVPGTDHADAFVSAPAEYADRVEKYFRGRLRGEGGR